MEKRRLAFVFAALGLLSACGEAVEGGADVADFDESNAVVPTEEGEAEQALNEDDAEGFRPGELQPLRRGTKVASPTLFLPAADRLDQQASAGNGPQMQAVRSGVVVGGPGKLFVGNRLGQVFAITPSGSQIWENDAWNGWIRIGTIAGMTNIYSGANGLFVQTATKLYHYENVVDSWTEIYSIAAGDTFVAALNGSLYRRTSANELYLWRSGNNWLKLSSTCSKMYQGRRGIYSQDAQGAIWAWAELDVPDFTEDGTPIWTKVSAESVAGWAVDTSRRMYRLRNPSKNVEVSSDGVGWTQIGTPRSEIFAAGRGTDVLARSSANGDVYRYNGSAWEQLTGPVIGNPIVAGYRILGVDPTTKNLMEFSQSPYVITQAGSTTNETDGGSGGTSFSVRLAEAPSASVVLSFRVSDATEASLDRTSITFTTTNWSTAVTVNVRGKQDSLIDGSRPFNVQFTKVTSTDPRYNGLEYLPPSLSFGNLDDELGFVVDTPQQVTESSGDGVRYRIKLSKAPTATVTAALRTQNFGVGAFLAGTSMAAVSLSRAFTTSNWDTWQDFVVLPIDDETLGNTNWNLMVSGRAGSPPAWLLPERAIPLVTWDNDYDISLGSPVQTGCTTRPDGNGISVTFPVATDSHELMHQDDSSEVYSKVLHVVLRNTYQKSFSDDNIADWLRQQSQGMHFMESNTRERVRVKNDFVIVDRYFGRDLFVGNGEVASGKQVLYFDGWDAIAHDVKALGYPVSNYDLIQVSYPEDSSFGDITDPGGAYAGPGRVFGPTGPRHTLHYRNRNATSFAHEVAHHLVWQFRARGIASRSPDYHDAWWATAYPAAESTIDPNVESGEREKATQLTALYAGHRHDWNALATGADPMFTTLTKSGLRVSRVLRIDGDSYRDQKLRCSNGTECHAVAGSALQSCACKP